MNETVTITKTCGDYIRNNRIRTGKFYKVVSGEFQVNYPGSWTKKVVIDNIQNNFGIDAVIKFAN